MTKDIKEGIIDTFLKYRLEKKLAQKRHEHKMAELQAKKNTKGKKKKDNAAEVARDRELKVKYHSGQFQKYEHHNAKVASYHEKQLKDLGYDVKRSQKQTVKRTGPAPHAGLYQWTKK